jgi:hypothetical protein
MENSKLETTIQNVKRNIELIASLELAPILPYVSFISFDQEVPTAYARVTSELDWQDMLHCAEKSGFGDFYSFEGPAQEPNHITRIGLFTHVFDNGYKLVLSVAYLFKTPEPSTVE